VVAVIDQREKEGSWMAGWLNQHWSKVEGMKAEVRTLEIGDITWFVRETLEGDKGEWEYDWYAGHVIEKKTVPDLAASIMGTRWMEQKLRLKMMRGRKYYLIEGVGSVTGSMVRGGEDRSDKLTT